MSAPKPRVYWDAILKRWTTQCDGCRIKGWETSWQRTIKMAVKHSRTHTAERIADELDRRAEREYIPVGAFEQTRDPWAMHRDGRAVGANWASRLIREHLVGRTS